jgi:hypothetical protein
MRYAFIPYGLSYVDALERVGLKRVTMRVISGEFIWPVGAGSSYHQVSDTAEANSIPESISPRREDQ